MEIVLATHNLHKIREFRELFKMFSNIDLLSLHQFPELQLPEETGVNFKENALIKARYVVNQTSRWVIGDDSGLVVPMLKGAPGIYSSRYAGEEATDSDNRRKLLQEMRQFKRLERAAYFECCLALCGPEGTEKVVTGICEGMIITEERGRNGFGYDSLFLKHDYEKTFAEIDDTVKNKISHRSKAFDKLSLALESLGADRASSKRHLRTDF